MSEAKEGAAGETARTEAPAPSHLTASGQWVVDIAQSLIENGAAWAAAGATLGRPMINQTGEIIKTVIHERAETERERLRQNN